MNKYRWAAIQRTVWHRTDVGWVWMGPDGLYLAVSLNGEMKQKFPTARGAQKWLEEKATAKAVLE